MRRSVLALLLAPVSLALAQSSVPAVRMTDVTVAAGLKSFTHSSGGSGRYYFVEQWGSGAAFLDYDGDGRLDIFLAQGGALPGYTGTPPSGNRLFRNMGNGTFSDVTKVAGLEGRRYTLGAATADYDNDGDADLFITALPSNVLYQNDGGRFTDVTAKAGVGGKPLSTSAAFLDFDADGRLDLFVARYLDYDVAADQGCEVPMMFLPPPRPGDRPGPRKMFCGPDGPGTPNILYRNEGGGVFKDVSVATGVAKHRNRGLGVAAADFNDDGRLDIFVASDQMPNLLFAGSANGSFEERALAAGVGVNQDGLAYAGMGVDAADYDNDGRIDLTVTNFEHEPTTLFRNTGNGTFVDESAKSGLSPLVWGFMKWGVRLLDFNGDGLKDVFTANGQIFDDMRIAPSKGIPLPGSTRKGYEQESQLIVQSPRGTFRDASPAAGPYFAQRRVARGGAFADFDDDGDWDVLVTNINASPSLLRNDVTPARWARLHLRGDGCNRDAIGAIVRVTAGGLTQTDVVRSGTSYLSDHDRRALFALPGNAPATMEVRWPCGAVQRAPVSSGKTTTITEQVCQLKRPK